MSVADTSFALTRGTPLNVKKTITADIYKYIDIDSTYRDRNLYRNPNQFVIPLNYPSRTANSSTAIDPIVGGIPFTGSSLPVASNVTQSSVGLDPNQVALGINEPAIDNYYINDVLQLSQFPTTFYTITAYDGTTKVATVSVDFPSVPTTGQVYFTRQAIPFFQGTVDTGTVVPTTSSFALNSLASSSSNIYVNSFAYFTTGLNTGQSARVTAYNGATKTITLATVLPFVPVNGDAVELDSYTRDNASTLIYAGNVSNNSQTGYYEIELLWLSFPNQLIGNGYGGKLDAYPYVYVQLYNQGNQLASNVFYSNNPNSINALFKVPVNQYFGDTYFMTLRDARTKQIVQFHPDQDMYFAVTFGDGTTIQFDTADNLSPNAPNPLLQVNALFSIRKVSS